MQGEGRRTSFSVASGIVAGLLTVAGTWLYLDSIDIDDGLEGLIVLPILALACALLAVWLGYQRSRLRHPIVCALGATATVIAALLIMEAARDRGGPPVLQNLALGIFVLLPIALLGALVGYSAGWITHSVFGRDRDSDDLQPASSR